MCIVAPANHIQGVAEEYALHCYYRTISYEVQRNSLLQVVHYRLKAATKPKEMSVFILGRYTYLNAPTSLYIALS
jgi:hypothetical protein